MTTLLSTQADLRTEAEHADRVMLIGCLLCGTFVLGPLGLAVMLWAFARMRRLERQGYPIRPWAVTLIGVFSLVDATILMLGWSLDVVAHDTILGRTFFISYGKAFDAGYVWGYNTTSFGGTALASDKALSVFSVFILFPMRVVAAHAFLKMKRWGFQYMVVTAWLYLVLWLGYIVQMSLHFDERFGNATFGVVGWWVANGIFLTPFITLPWMFTVKKELWTE